mgnify:CR=1 FL=1
MKIPLYQSQGQMTREAPGRSISARMSMAGPRAIAEQGKVLQTAIQEVGSYAEMKYKMLDEIERNEAIFGAKEAIRDTAFRFKTGNDLRVLEGGKDSKWNQEMDAIRIGLTDNMRGSRASRFMFDQEFRVASSNAEFILKETIHDKLELRSKAARGARTDQTVSILSDDNVDPAQFPFELASLEEMVKRAAGNQMVNPELVASIEPKVRKGVAANLAMAFAGRDVYAVRALEGALDVFELIESGEITAEEAIADGRLEEVVGAEYALNMLLSIPRGQANEILEDVANTALKFQKMDDVAIANDEKFVKEMAAKMHMIARSNQLDPGSEVTFEQMAPYFDFKLEFLKVSNDEAATAQLNERLGVTTKIVDGEDVTVMDGGKVRQYLHDYLSSNDLYKSSQAENMERLIESENSIATEPEVSLESVLEDFDKALFSKTLTMEDIQFAAANGRITRSDEFDYQTKIKGQQTRRNQALDRQQTKTFSNIRRAFNLQDSDATSDDEGVKVSRRYSNNVQEELQNLMDLPDGDPNKITTPRQLIDVTKELIAGYKEDYKTDLQSRFKAFLESSQLTGRVPELVININTLQPRNDIEAKWSSLSDSQKQVTSTRNYYFALLAEIASYEDRGAFE